MKANVSNEKYVVLVTQLRNNGETRVDEVVRQKCMREKQLQVEKFIAWSQILQTSQMPVDDPIYPVIFSKAFRVFCNFRIRNFYIGAEQEQNAYYLSELHQTRQIHDYCVRVAVNEESVCWTHRSQ